ncbi:MAG TPA: type II secretion system protein, partial [Thermoanaerobaculia bacterium]|nr:type II secretion system protein [Thermoanaerobaculia bacterium]
MGLRTTSCSAPGRRRDRGQAGFTLAAVIVLVTIVAIFAAYTVPRQWSTIMQRERELQTIFVMKQYAWAIKNFQQKNNALPTSLDQVIDARSPRLIRGIDGWVCPLTGEKDWILIPPTAVGQTVGTNPANPA